MILETDSRNSVVTALIIDKDEDEKTKNIIITSFDRPKKFDIDRNIYVILKEENSPLRRNFSE